LCAQCLILSFPHLAIITLWQMSQVPRSPC